MAVSTPIRLAALLGAAAVSVAWLWRSTGLAAPPPVDAPAPTVPMPTPAVRIEPPVVPVAAAPARLPPPMPYAYVGLWREGSQIHVLLKRGALTTRVTGFSAVDEQYVIVAADEQRVSLRYLPLGTVQTILLERPQPVATESARTPSARSDSEAQSEEN